MKKGFTLLELIIIIAIIGIMMAVSLVSMSSSKKYYALKTAQEEVTSAIKLAQSYALQGKTTSQCPTTVYGYGFEFTGSNPTADYRIFCCPANDSCQTQATVESNSLKNGVKIDNGGFAKSVYFDIPNAKTSSQTYFLFVYNNALEKIISISSSGLVTQLN
ncbi:MAG TPA: prepilin-type N-terminal cleavage/methylation domain-containing protein [Candidatus Moranbacteria bacterium]|nr:prepilin-type N-terminal cleavage/methylation domain-containing protein [Candidatus Moranbacteria bacterium]